jgi:hypothetical protein
MKIFKKITKSMIVGSITFIALLITALYYSIKYFRKEKQNIDTGSSSFSPDGNLPRGLRNNNPLNIRRSSDKWKGLSDGQKDESFFSFKALKYGYRAAYKILSTYQTKYNIKSVLQTVKRWAPSEDGNNPTKYFNTVQIEMAKDGFIINQTTNIDLSKIDFCISLLRAMAIVENGYGFESKIRKTDILNGINLA